MPADVVVSVIDNVSVPSTPTNCDGIDAIATPSMPPLGTSNVPADAFFIVLSPARTTFSALPYFKNEAAVKKDCVCAASGEPNLPASSFSELTRPI